MVGGSSPAAAISIRSFTCPDTPCMHVHPSVNGPYVSTRSWCKIEGRGKRAAIWKALGSHLSRALLELSVHIDALQMVAAHKAGHMSEHEHAPHCHMLAYCCTACQVPDEPNEGHVLGVASGHK